MQRASALLRVWHTWASWPPLLGFTLSEFPPPSILMYCISIYVCVVLLAATLQCVHDDWVIFTSHNHSNWLTHSHVCPTLCWCHHTRIQNWLLILFTIFMKCKCVMNHASNKKTKQNSAFSSKHWYSEKKCRCCQAEAHHDWGGFIIIIIYIICALFIYTPYACLNVYHNMRRSWSQSPLWMPTSGLMSTALWLKDFNGIQMFLPLWADVVQSILWLCMVTTPPYKTFSIFKSYI